MYYYLKHKFKKKLNVTNILEMHQIDNIFLIDLSFKDD